ncbi:MAG: anthranilate phosphoribosyltransferase [Nitrospiraceae bacterium]|nr:anthranilate phosphoribosyltransferase [Nitrospiraceae bacterium]MSR24244.1 anthranilate phosphoribosyltransferase [Nitrospiraceae bacterium]
MTMQEIIAKIGSGQKTSKDLTWDESKQTMRALIEGQATPAQIGAFLLAMRLKMESVTELAAFTSAAREYAAPVPVPQGLALVDLPVYGGKQDTFHASIGAAVVAAAGGAAILMHGHDIIPKRPGPAGVLTKLGIATELAPKQAAGELATKGFAYLDMALYHPSVAKFLDLRLELGVRNLFHPVARMLNPARAGVQIVGLTHPPYFEKTAEALSMLGCRQALIIRGIEGSPELSIAAATKVLELRGDRITPLMLHPKDADVPLGTHQPMAGFPPGQTDREADLLRKILSNQVRGGQRDWVLLNAALFLYAAGKAVSVQAGAKLAQQALDSGAAARKLNELAVAKETIRV